VELALPRARPTAASMTAIPFSDVRAEEDALLVRRARSGDETAFTDLYRRYVRVVHGLLLARIPPSEVEDLVQDVFLSAWKRLDSLRDPGAFGGWLSMIARNRAADLHRREAETLRSMELPESIRSHDTTAERVDALTILSVIRGLPDAYCETLILRLVEGLTGPEIAQRTGLTAASVRVNLHRGMKLLRERLNV
jgi:RNA polymerase sigma-70 factor (ECF subfamily)